MTPPFIAGLYFGVGLCAGLWYYLGPMPGFMDEPGRVIKAIQAIIVAVGWLPLIAIVIVEVET